MAITTTLVAAVATIIAALVPVLFGPRSSTAKRTSGGTAMEVRIDPTGKLPGEAIGAPLRQSSDIRDNVSAQIWNKTRKQRWLMKVVDTSDRGQWVVTFRNLHYDDMCLDAPGNLIILSDVNLHACDNSRSQQWILEKVGTVPYADVFLIRNRAHLEKFDDSEAACLIVNSDESRIGSCVEAVGPSYAIYKLS